jgi:hypothetical protein
VTNFRLPGIPWGNKFDWGYGATTSVIMAVTKAVLHMPSMANAIDRYASANEGWVTTKLFPKFMLGCVFRRRASVPWSAVSLSGHWLLRCAEKLSDIRKALGASQKTRSRIAASCLWFVIVLTLPTLGVKADWLGLLHADAGGSLGGNWDAKVEIETKWRSDMSEQYDFEAMPWVGYRLSKWFRLGLGWRELYSRKNTAIFNKQSMGSPPSPTYLQVSDCDWQVEHRPVADIILTIKSGIWKVENRLRTEYREVQDQDAYFRYRNRLRLESPWRWTRAEVKPWLAWEAYYENNPDWDSGDRLNRHRFFVGLNARLTSVLQIGGYYYWERALRNNVWESNHEIGLGITLANGAERPKAAP